MQRGERAHIFPFTENSDAIFNSSLVHELSVLRPQAEPLLLQVRPDTREYREANRLLSFLQWFRPAGHDVGARQLDPARVHRRVDAGEFPDALIDDVRQPQRHKEHGDAQRMHSGSGGMHRASEVHPVGTRMISVRPLCSPCLCG